MGRVARYVRRAAGGPLSLRSHRHTFGPPHFLVCLVPYYLGLQTARRLVPPWWVSAFGASGRSPPTMAHSQLSIPGTHMVLPNIWGHFSPL